MTVPPEKIWMQGGRIYIREGWLEIDGRGRLDIAGGDVRLADGYLCFNGPPPEIKPGYQGPERRSGLDRRARERR